MKAKELKNEIKVLDITALIARTKALNIEINDLVLDKNINRLKNLKSISNKRKEMARVLTAMAQKKLIASLEPKEVKTEEKSPVEISKKAEKTKQSLPDGEKVKKGADKK